MPIVYAGGTNVNTTFSNSGSATRREVVDGIVSALTTAGWSTISGSGTGDVVMESVADPNGLKMRVRLLDPGSGTCAQVKIRNTSNSLSQAGALYLRPENSKTWRVIANRYQCFVFVPATSTVARDFAAWGTVAIPSRLNGIITDCIWGWGNAQGDSDSSVRDCFRTKMCANSNFSMPNMMFIVNAGYWESNASNFSNASGGLPSLVYPAFAGYQNIGSATNYRWHGDKAPMFEPYFAFGATSSVDEAKVRGQLWDAFISLDSYAKDATLSSIDSHNWWNITDANVGASRNHQRGCLWLVVP